MQTQYYRISSLHLNIIRNRHQLHQSWYIYIATDAITHTFNIHTVSITSFPNDVTVPGARLTVTHHNPQHRARNIPVFPDVTLPYNFPKYIVNTFNENQSKPVTLTRQFPK